MAVLWAMALLGAAGTGWIYYEQLDGNLRRDKLNLGQKPMENSPNAAGQRSINVLVLGSDSRASKENRRLGGAAGESQRPPLADVQMLVHLSADRSNISVVSIPRDTLVRIPECQGPDGGKPFQPIRAKINASLARGGPGCTVATWFELTGIPIDHFIMADFAGVVDIADAIGGVPVCVDANIHSRGKGHGSGLKLKKGTTRIRGAQALQWLRTRYGFEDNGDIGRTHAQHMYMSSMVRELQTGLGSPRELMRLAEAATKTLTVDEGMGVKDLYELAQKLRRVPPERITSTTMPWMEDPQNNGHVLPMPGDAEKLFSLVRRDIALDGKPSKATKNTMGHDRRRANESVDVLVLNGTRTHNLPAVEGRARDISKQLVSKGFERAAVRSTPRRQRETTVTYPAGLSADALAVAEALDLPKAAVSEVSNATEITVVVGSDWRSGSTYPEAAQKSRDDERVPNSAAPLRADDRRACMKVNRYYTW
ncbi:LCP family protein [Streptomyces sp. M41]|uniref:LCP family protein n=1 Tax=Streptomyces sp. M41 TaxID=3059412 RepID=UPI00374CB6F7